MASVAVSQRVRHVLLRLSLSQIQHGCSYDSAKQYKADVDPNSLSQQRLKSYTGRQLGLLRTQIIPMKTPSSEVSLQDQVLDLDNCLQHTSLFSGDFGRTENFGQNMS